MTIWNIHFRHLWMAFWAYLRQPIFDKERHTTLNPHKFAYSHNIQFLERCLKLDNTSENFTEKGDL
ncbi:MAG: hypothetical protein AAF215_14595 [Cyanobacteria bacterium P01_A01_bin.123]